MRDTRGRYTSTKEIADSVPAWAKGCDACTCGIMSAPEITGAVSFYLERLVQAVDGDIIFCTCQAGQRYRVSLLNRHRTLIEEAKRDKRTVDSARSKTHPDIESARLAIQTVRGASIPTIHYEAAEAELV